MPTPTYSFVEQLEMGQAGEKVLDSYFARWYDIKEASIDEQIKQKIDRHFRPRHIPNAEYIKIEYKTDDKTDATGNLFIETWSAYELRRYGWAWLTQADKIIYYALPDTLYIIERKMLQEQLLVWMSEKRKLHKVRNIGYTSRGYAIPTEEIVQLIGEKNVRVLG